ncbi:MAG TPA: hypothetical protein VFT04_14270 [Gemmatimonadales bacterium]|nr:hypothetical protein [Gemmatimonadales bacterium]
MKGALGFIAILSGCASAPQPERSPAPEPASPEAPAEVVTPSEGRGREIEYSAGSSRFRIDRFDTVSVTMPDGSAQQQSFRRSAWLSLSTEERGDGLRAEISLDSLDVSGAPVAQAALDSARGTEWTANVAADGELGDVVPNRQSTIGDQVGALLQLLFPRFPGSSIRAGARWSDTTDAPTKADNFDVQERAVMQYMAGTPATRRGRSVLPIVATGTFTREGTGSQLGRTLEMESKGSRRFTHFIGIDGTPAGLEGTETNEVTITVPEMGQSIQATQSGTIQVTPIASR